MRYLDRYLESIQGHWTYSMIKDFAYVCGNRRRVFRKKHTIIEICVKEGNRWCQRNGQPTLRNLINQENKRLKKAFKREL